MPDDDAHTVQSIGHRVGRGLHRAEQGNHAHHNQPSKLKEAVFAGRGNANVQNAAHHGAVNLGKAFPLQEQLLPGIRSQGKDHHRGHRPGYHRGHCHTGDTHLQHKNAQRVSRHIDDVHQNADLHGHLTVAGAAENRRSRVVQRDKGEGQGGKAQIEQSRRHNLRRDGAKEQPQQPPGEYQTQRHCRHAQSQGHEHQLSGTAPGLLWLPRTQKLTGHHRAASGQGSEQGQHHRVDHIH